LQDSSSAYDVHPSERLRELFFEKPYQGEDPTHAKVIVLGNDANYSPQISKHPFFERILDYHQDGVRFWRLTGFHHPFLLPDYPFHKRKGGVPYHANFRKLGFSASDADKFSFVELLNVPTIGNTGSNKNLFFRLLDEQHLDWLERLILDGKPKFVLVNQTLSRSIKVIAKKTGRLTRLAPLIFGKPAPTVAYRSDNVTIFNGYSFSASISNMYLEGLARTMREYIQSN
jgi:hypothetical protein